MARMVNRWTLRPDVKHYPTIDLRLVEARGIDAEASTEALIAECRTWIPPRLWHGLQRPFPRHGTEYSYKFARCRCDACSEAKRRAA